MKAQIWNYKTWIEETCPAELKKRFSHMLTMAGFSVLDIMEHHFHPYGYTCVFLLGESHFAIHTFPEEEKTYIELSSCNEKMYGEFLKALEKYTGRE